MTLAEVLPVVRQLTAAEKLILMRLLAEDIGGNDASALLQSGKVYNLPTPYDSYGAAQVLADALAAADEQETAPCASRI
ncbi:MAG: hypothetical protein HOP18_15130 [Deltaproteobacteria bacterium]|nr:hypothetical protein [Deltaproteobacteria bacterium]